MTRDRSRAPGTWRLGAAVVLVLAGAEHAGAAHAGTAQATERFEWRLPPGFPEPLVPRDNPMSSAKLELGRRLFLDERLSVTGAYSCASCHRPELAFTDGRRTAVGATGEHHARNTPSLFNAAYNASYGWADPDVRTLERQHLVPMFNREPVELGLDEHNLPVILAALSADPALEPLWRAAYPNDHAKGYGLRHVTNALAAYIRTLMAGNSAYDRYVYYDERERMNEKARRGLALFFSQPLGCSECHASFNFSGPVRHARAPDVKPVFHNTGLYHVGGTGAGPDRGLAHHTGRKRDAGAFRAPSLRNVARTAPYMHDGSIETLGEVIDVYAAGGRWIAVGPLAGDGRKSPYKRSRIAGFQLSSDDRAALIAFLESLTELPSSLRATPAPEPVLAGWRVPTAEPSMPDTGLRTVSPFLFIIRHPWSR